MFVHLLSSCLIRGCPRRDSFTLLLRRYRRMGMKMRAAIQTSGIVAAISRLQEVHVTCDNRSSTTTNNEQQPHEHGEKSVHISCLQIVETSQSPQYHDRQHHRRPITKHQQRLLFHLLSRSSTSRPPIR